MDFHDFFYKLNRFAKTDEMFLEQLGHYYQKFLWNKESSDISLKVILNEIAQRFSHPPKILTLTPRKNQIYSLDGCVIEEEKRIRRTL